MNRARLRGTIELLVTSIAAIAGMAPAAAEDAVLARDLERLAAMLPGVYDNQEQVYFEGELEVPEAARHERRRMAIVALESSPEGDRLFEWRRYDEAASAPSARGLLALGVDGGSGALRMRRYTLPLQADTARAALAPEAVGTRECDVLWRRRAGQFEGRSDPAGCDRGRAGGDWLLADSELQLTAAAAGLGTGVESPFVLRRARPFSCWVAVPLRDSERWHFDGNLDLYDQGGTAEVVTDEPEPQRVRIKMRNVVWPSGTNRDSLVLYVYREDEEAAAAYAWGEPTATRLAINLRWMQASCTLAE